LLRVAGVGAGVEWFGYGSRAAIKEWLGWSAVVLGVIALGLTMSWRSRPSDEPHE